MIMRRWHAAADNERPYLSHFRRRVLHELCSISGFEGALVLRRRTTGKQLDIEVLTFWRSMNAIRRFAGPNTERAVVEDDAKAVLLTFARRAQHFEVILDARTTRGQARNAVRTSRARQAKRSKSARQRKVNTLKDRGFPIRRSR